MASSRFPCVWDDLFLGHICSLLCPFQILTWNHSSFGAGPAPHCPPPPSPPQSGLGAIPIASGYEMLRKPLTVFYFVPGQPIVSKGERNQGLFFFFFYHFSKNALYKGTFFLLSLYDDNTHYHASIAYFVPGTFTYMISLSQQPYEIGNMITP